MRTRAGTQLTPGHFAAYALGFLTTGTALVKPAGFILPCQPYLAERPPTGPEIKWDGYRIIGRKEGGRVRLWARTGTDYTPCLDRIRAAVAALPTGGVVLDGEAVVVQAGYRQAPRPVAAPSPMQ